jgi:hypothetical protein
MLAETLSWTNLLGNQLPFAVLLVSIGYAGNKKIWRFGHQYDEMRETKEAEIARLHKEQEEDRKERDVQIDRVRRDTEVEIARLKEERERERTRADRYETLVLRSNESNREVVELVTAAMKRVRE